MTDVTPSKIPDKIPMPKTIDEVTSLATTRAVFLLKEGLVSGERRRKLERIVGDLRNANIIELLECVDMFTDFHERIGGVMLRGFSEGKTGRMEGLIGATEEGETK